MSTARRTPAALGVLIVDEAVYALQDMQPGLEKVFFTLQEELLKPQAQVLFKPIEPIDALIVRDTLSPEKQQIAQVLLTAIKPKPPARWEVNPAAERRIKMESTLHQLHSAIFQQAVAMKGDAIALDQAKKQWVFAPDLLDKVTKAYGWTKDALVDPVGVPISIERIVEMDKSFTPEALARSITQRRIQQMTWSLINYSNGKQATLLKGGKWTFPASTLIDAAKQNGLSDEWRTDAWGQHLSLMSYEKRARTPQVGPSLTSMRSSLPDRMANLARLTMCV